MGMPCLSSFRNFRQFIVVRVFVGLHKFSDPIYPVRDNISAISPAEIANNREIAYIHTHVVFFSLLILVV